MEAGLRIKNEEVEERNLYIHGMPACLGSSVFRLHSPCHLWALYTWLCFAYRCIIHMWSVTVPTICCTASSLSFAHGGSSSGSSSAVSMAVENSREMDGNLLLTFYTWV